MQQLDVPGAVADPMRLVAQTEIALGIIMFAERAAQRHQAVTDQAFRERAAPRSECRRDAVAGDTGG
jgi:chorismate-pyruvate lyase